MPGKQLDESLIFFCAGGRALHEHWLVKTGTDGAENGDIEANGLDQVLVRVAFKRKGAPLGRLDVERGLVHVAYGLSLDDDVAQSVGVGLPLGVQARLVEHGVLVAHLG